MSRFKENPNCGYWQANFPGAATLPGALHRRLNAAISRLRPAGSRLMHATVPIFEVSRGIHV
jgi:hypothetical protein